MELTKIGSSSFSHGQASSHDSGGESVMEENEELQLQLDAIEKLPTFKRINTSPLGIIKEKNDDNDNDSTKTKKKVTDVTKLGALENKLFIEKIIKHIENDNFWLLHQVRDRIYRVNMKLPKVEVRYNNLTVEAECQIVQGTHLPTLWNSIARFFFSLTKVVLVTNKSDDSKISILKDVRGIIKPSRLTLLLGPPGCGKTTLLSALAGKLDSLKVSGEISYNGYKLDEFVPQKTSAYVSQHDLHIPEMTVRETIDFSARCQGVVSRAAITGEVSKREKEAGIAPDPDVDTYMKAISVEGQARNLQTDYVLKILGLDICADVMVGSTLRRGISGGQKKRLTTGEMIVGPTKALIMDDISTGLDSSTTFQIVKYLQQLVHINDATAFVSLLQPAPETFNLFDDLVLMAEGKIVYHGPCSQALRFFQDCGFKCPERKGTADFLHEVISEKDQGQYWTHNNVPYNYVSADQFSQMFRESYLGRQLNDKLSKPYDKSQSDSKSLSFSKHSLGNWQLVKACMARECLLMKRNSFVYVFKTVQLIITAFMTMTVFIQTRMTTDDRTAEYVMGSMFYTIVRLYFNGVAELPLTITRLPAINKQMTFYLYPAWAYSIPAVILKIPFSLLDSVLWTSMTYYVIGYSPDIGRFFRQIFLLFVLHQSSTSMYRFIAAVFQTMIVATTVNTLFLVLMYLFGGFIIAQPSLPPWLGWGFWLSPLTYGEIGLSLNEFTAPRWQKVMTGNTTIGTNILTNHGLNFPIYFYWISVGALLVFTLLFDVGFILALTYLKSPKMKLVISRKKLSQPKEGGNSATCLKSLSALGTNAKTRETGRLILPFEPLTITFKDVQYFFDTPPERRKHGHDKKLQLLQDITGAFRPGVLTALMGASGAGKTTLMDVLSGRKTIGTIEGEIRISGYPKIQKTFSRISGYCEQHDIHSPHITVEESVMFSAWLRLSQDINADTRSKFVQEVIETVELDGHKDSLVGIPGQSGLSIDQRKRLTIAVELVSNPSIMFMDEPTSGLDARAAAIVMRAVKNVVDTGRTTVCTIHQPSIDVFEIFDELILMKLGGRIIYSGLLGHQSSKVIEYFESIPGVPKIKDNYSPATWMLEVTSPSNESKLGLDFEEIYKKSTLYRDTLQLVTELSEPKAGSRDLSFPTLFPQTSSVQFVACLWKQRLSYWRSPEYNVARFTFMIISSLMFAVVFWQKGKELKNEQDLFNVLGLMYTALMSLGPNNSAAIMPYVETERSVLYRETFAGMYSSWAYSFAQMAIEIPYILVQAILFVAITYPSIGFYWSVQKILWYFYVTFCTLLYFVYLGMLLVSMSSNIEIASISGPAVNTILNLFSGFLMPGPKIPKWWTWCYWLSPTSWSLNGLLNSQYGDLEKEILVYGEMKTVRFFLLDHYGFHHDQLGLVGVILFAFPIAFAILFAFCIRMFNFQKR